jgi:hypothetical protein
LKTGDLTDEKQKMKTQVTSPPLDWPSIRGGAYDAAMRPPPRQPRLFPRPMCGQVLKQDGEVRLNGRGWDVNLWPVRILDHYS